MPALGHRWCYRRLARRTLRVRGNPADREVNTFMSAPLAGKFQDHYEVLGVEPTAELEAIQLAYTRLAQEFHPSQPETGDREKFDAINLAYEVLSQQDLRSTFDKLKGIGTDKGSPKFSGLPFFDSFGRANGLRAALLCVLYERRRQKPFTPSLSVRHVENIVSASLEEMTWVMWYLKERRWVISDDKSSLQITLEGMDFLESNPPSAELVMPWIKPSGLVEPAVAAASAVQIPPAAVSEEPANGLAGFEEVTPASDPLDRVTADNAPEEPVLGSASSTIDDPSRRANLNRILAR